MTYAEAGERASLIEGLRTLARFLEDHPGVPAPRSTSVLVFPPGSTDREVQAEIDAIAALIGSEVHDDTAHDGHYTTSRDFGPVEYRAVAIPWCNRKPAPTQGEEA